jgi:hypothetical protein
MGAVLPRRPLAFSNPLNWWNGLAPTEERLEQLRALERRTRP